MIKKETLLKKICELADFAVADGNTYLYSKCFPNIEIDSKKINIGGGNFTILLSSLACIEFLGTINAIIEGKDNDYWNDEEISELNKVKKILSDEFKENPEYIQKYIMRPFNDMPKAGELKKSGSACLREILKDTAILTELSVDEIEKLARVRNKLAHEFTPKFISAAGISPAPGADFINLIKQYKHNSVFCVTAVNTIGIDSNALNSKIYFILKYVVEKFDTISEDKLLKIELFLKKL